VIKANFPSRIAFQVASKTDSRTILDFNGAERLLGMGDMLFLPGGQGEPVRIHGAFVSGEETDSLVEAIKSSGYQTEEVAVFSEHGDINAAASARDELFEEAVRLTLEHRQASTSFLQRRMKVGYSRAARLMDQLEMAGIVGPAEGAKPRQILVDAASARDELFEEAVRLTLEHRQASTSFLQRRMKVGYSRAARLMDQLEMAGIVGPAEGAKPRQILVDADGMSGAAAEDEVVA
jgi:S-DNA-T family DNA segregation ATPase FtsK/SpoIIIE